MCVAKPTSSWKNAEFQAFWTGDQSTFITADNIAANTITGNEIAANTISANELNVNQLSAISANLWDVHVGDVSWTWTWIRLYPYNTNMGIMTFYYNWNVIWQLSAWQIAFEQKER